MENTLRLFIPIFDWNVHKWISGGLVIVMLCGLALFSGTLPDVEEQKAPGKEKQMIQSKAAAFLEPSVVLEPKAEKIVAGEIEPSTHELKSDRMTQKDVIVESDRAVQKDSVPQNISGETVEKEESVSEPAEEAVTVWKVICYGNGGFPEKTSYSFEKASFDGSELAVPSRPGKIFTGWYEDEACTIPFERAEGEIRELALYAGWKEIDGFTSDDNGYLTGCEPRMVSDGLLILPTDDCCKGIGESAFEKVAELVEEIYIPGNITYIAPEAFDCLTNLFYIEVSPDNPVYYSENGSLYEKNGTLIVSP